MLSQALKCVVKENKIGELFDKKEKQILQLKSFFKMSTYIDIRKTLLINR